MIEKKTLILSFFYLYVTFTNLNKILHMKFLLFFVLILLLNCSKNKEEFEVIDFEPLSNYNTDTSNIKTLLLDYDNAIETGFIIPGINQVEDGYFKYSFKIKNNGKSGQEFFYKIYYQNETYAFDLVDKSGNINPLSSENFYGSFDNPEIGFLSTGLIPSDGDFHEIVGQFRIKGNPRNEKRYFGVELSDKYISPKLVSAKMEDIKSNPEWFTLIQQKSVENKMTVEEQLNLDALYIINQARTTDSINQPWKRNPRTGSYSFLLTVVKKENLSKIPEYIQHIDKISENNEFLNPFYYYLYRIKNQNWIKSIKKDNLLNVKAHVNLSKGVYFNKLDFGNRAFSSQVFSSTCGCDSILFHNAPLQQFFHTVDQNEIFYNIPIIADVYGDEYSKSDYLKNAGINKNNRKKSIIQVAENPCIHVGIDSNNYAFMINPPATNEKMQKQNVGLVTRHGLTYGKYRAKVKLPSLLNKYNIWNGLTNAIWMVTQSNQDWNSRRKSDSGYNPKHMVGTDSARVPILSYSEIDFEILKCNRYWPKTSYFKQENTPKETKSDESNIVITCTNWDMACKDPIMFNIGYIDYEMNGKKWGWHRWDTWFQAITAKYPIEDVFDNDYYYFEIEWNPHEIIWRVGPEKDKMFIVGYVNDSVSAIPNNQMLLVFTQEYHVGRWWPESAMPQENIPFPATEIKGYIMEIEIE